MHKLLVVALLAAAAACGGGKSSTNTTPEAPPSPCAPMAKHLGELFVKAGAEQGYGPDKLAKLGDAMERVASERCTADAWSAEVISCISAADDKSLDPCIEMLTDEQQKALDRHVSDGLGPALADEPALAEET